VGGNIVADVRDLGGSGYRCADGESGMAEKNTGEMMGRVILGWMSRCRRSSLTFSYSLDMSVILGYGQHLLPYHDRPAMLWKGKGRTGYVCTKYNRFT